MMRLLVLICSLTYLCIMTCYAQKTGEKLFVRHSLIFMKGEMPKATPTSIVFTSLSFCGFSSLPYSGSVIRRGEEISVGSIDRKPNPAQVSVGSKSATFVLELANSSEKEFQRSFDLLFTRKRVDFGSATVKTEKGLIKNYGFPIARCAENGGFFYIIEFSPVCGSFDGCVVQVSKKGLSVTGYI